MNAMMLYISEIFHLSTIIVLWNTNIVVSDKPCAAKAINNRSVICVCNVTYCDEIKRITPTKGQFVTYTTSKAGSRFKKYIGSLEALSDSTYPQTLKLLPQKRNQVINGFGGAVTDSVAYNWLTLSNKSLKKYLIDSYFGPKGIGYNMIRVPIGGTDFSTHSYAYNELPVNDTHLTNYSLSFEDIYYKIPMIKSCIKACPTKVRIVASTWSPPMWMKEHTKYSICGRLQPKFFHTYAKYHYKFIELYQDKGIPIWAITTTNEPTDGYLPVKKFNCLGWSSKRMGLWIANHLGPMIRNSQFKDVKILAVDDQRFAIPLWFNEMISENPACLAYIDGVALHYYADRLIPPEILYLVSKLHPDKFLLATEACQGPFPWQHPKVDLGSWPRAVAYIQDIITDLKYDVTGWIDWNMCLSKEGGPTWTNNFVDSPIIVAAAEGEFYKQPMFYAMGHFAKFIPRDSVRIDVEMVKYYTRYHRHLKDCVAFLTPQKTVVVVLFNKGKSTTVRLVIDDKQITVAMEAKSIVTVEVNQS